MTTYADPTHCPDCTALLGMNPDACHVCALPLAGPTALELFSVLQRADGLLERLRQEKAPVSALPAAEKPTGVLLDDATPYPSPRRPDLDAPRLTGASVPQILLGLGALCLLVAAVTFLAVAWSWLGVGGRTLVLVALTVTALGLVGVVHRRGLRMASEAMSVVGLGLLALDVVGARHAGWLGTVSDAHLVLLTGAVVATGSLVLVFLTGPRHLVAPAVVGPVAVLVAGLGGQWSVDVPAPLLVTAVVLLGFARIGTTLPSTPLWVTAVSAGSVAWVGVVAMGFAETLDDLTVSHLWAHAVVWPLMAAVLLAAAAAPLAGLGRVAATAGYSVAGLLGSYVVVLAAVDNSLTVATVGLLPLAVAWTIALTAAPERWRPIAVLPLAGTLVMPLVAVVELGATSARAAFGIGEPFASPFGVHVAETSPWLAVWLLAPCVIAVTAAGCALAGLAEPVRRTTWVVALGVAAVAGGVATLPLYDVPLALVVGVLAIAGAAALAAAERADGSRADALRVAGAALVLGDAAVALPNDVLTTLVLLFATAAAALLMSRTDHTGEIALGAFAPLFGALVWSAGQVASVPAYDRAIPVLLVLGALAIWRPDPTLEAFAALTGAFVSAAAVAGAHDVLWALAIHLTVAGVLVTASSLIHPSRRPLAWPGGLLLAAATWVRLAELGVHTPEAYTLPAALVLVAVGAWRMRRDDAPATLTLLAPGLTLATVPSLLVALDQPVSMRAVLLGATCLALVLAGIQLRWSAPVVVGSAVGALLVLRELAPYAATVPPWLLIGLSGTLLTLVGVTWESRMRDLRTASQYVARLR